jgi:PLD-like domain
VRRLQVAFLALASALAFTAPASASVFVTDLHGVRTELQTVNPDADPDGEDDAPVLDRMARMIRDVPPGQFVALGLFSVNYPDIREAIKEATTKGAYVYIVQSGDQADPSKLVALQLHQDLGANHHFCGAAYAPAPPYRNYSCNSSISPISANIIQHAKYAVFSQTRDTSNVLRSNVTWFGTANLTRETGGQAWNDTITVYGDTDLYNNFSNLWLTMATQNPRRPDYSPGADSYNHFFTAPTTGIEVKASPSSSDLVIEELNRVATGPGCEVRVIEAEITRPAVGTKLASMKSAGCSVQVLVNDLGCNSHRPMYNAGVTIKTRSRVHSKTMILKGSDGRYTVLTGSHNVSPGALNNDEILVRVPTDYSPRYLNVPLLHMGYVNYFNEASSRGTVPPPPAC